MKKLFAVFAMLLEVLGTLMAENYSAGVLTGADGTRLPYRYLSAPKGDGKKYPLVIFLHGAGERGTDNKAQLTLGGSLFSADSIRARYPAMVVAPQCPTTAFWAYPKWLKSFKPALMPSSQRATPQMLAVKRLIDSCMRLPNIDPRRVYLVGVSMGGMAVYDLVARYPSTFAAAVPICGSVNPSRLSRADGTVWRIIHGTNDKLVPVDAARQAYRALRRAGARVEIVEYPGVGHGVWTQAFARPDFMQWIFSQKRN